MEPAQHDQMKVFRDIAAEHGVDPSDEEAVAHFFEEVAPQLPEREEIYRRIVSINISLGDEEFARTLRETL